MKNYLRKRLLISILTALLITILAGSTVYGAGKPTISKTSFQLLVGKTYDLDIKNAAKNSTFAWSTSNKKVATVNKNGLVKGVAKGTATITCKVKTSGKTYSLSAKVTVIAPAKSITVTDREMQLKVGQTGKLGATITPSSSNDKITWSSEDKSIAAVDSTGKITAKKAGLTKVTATTISGKKATVSVAVYDDSLQRITAADLDDDTEVIIKNVTISNLYIEAMNAEITLDNVKITGVMTVESGLNNTVRIKKSTIASLKALPKKDVPLKDTERTALIAENKTVIWKANLQASSVLKRGNDSDIREIAMSPGKAGDYDMYISAYQGNLKVNYAKESNLRVELDGCSIATADILKASGEYLILTDNEDNPSSINTVNLKADTLFCLNIPTETLNINKSLAKANLLIGNTVGKLVSNGNHIGISVTEQAHVKEITDNKNNKGSYGSYTLLNSDTGKYAFTVLIGGIPIEGIQLEDFILILNTWKDKTKPYEFPQMPGVRVRSGGGNTYQLEIFGAVINLDIDPKAGAITLHGSDIFKITDIKAV